MTESVVGYAVENATGGFALAVLLAIGVGMSLLVVRERRSRGREQLARARAEKLSGQTREPQTRCSTPS
jgi:adenine/guanine phosphoribosyltransferase-like PRPP-binding protein